MHPVEDSGRGGERAAAPRRTACASWGCLAEASTVYGTAAEVATRASDMIGTLRARIGEAKVLAEKGNLPAADEMLRVRCGTGAASIR